MVITLNGYDTNTLAVWLSKVTVDSENKFRTRQKLKVPSVPSLKVYLKPDKSIKWLMFYSHPLETAKIFRMAGLLKLHETLF